MAVEDSVAQDQLKAFISRIERMEEEKAAIAADIKEIYAEAKGNGFDTKILRKIVTIRKQDANERMEQEALLELYMDALGMQMAHDSAMNDRLRGGGRSAPLFAGRVESISEPISEQQVAPQPASDLTVPPSPQGQVAPIQESPRKAAEAEGESPAFQVDAAASAEAEVDGQPSETTATTDRTISENVIGVTAGVTGGESAATNQAGDGSSVASKAETAKSVEPSGSAAPLSFADRIKKLRPLCQSPNACRSSGGKSHCHSCTKAANADQVLA